MHIVSYVKKYKKYVFLYKNQTTDQHKFDKLVHRISNIALQLPVTPFANSLHCCQLITQKIKFKLIRN